MIQLEAYCTGLGKVLLAHLDEYALSLYLHGNPLVALTAQTITEPVRLRAELERVMARGHAHDDAELEDDLYCLAVPVYSAGDVVAALSVSRTFEPWRDPARVKALQGCATRIGARLGASANVLQAEDDRIGP